MGQATKIIMKKLLFLSLVLLAGLTTSCKTIKATAVHKDPVTFLGTATVADLDVSSERITFTFVPTRQVRRGGSDNVIKAAVREALRVNGGGDVLVDLQYVTMNKKSLFGFLLSPICEITVSGYPAKYVNFHSLDDDAWAPLILCPDNCAKTSHSTSIFNFAKRK